MVTKMIQAVILVFTLGGYLEAKQDGFGINLSQTTKCKGELYDLNDKLGILSDCVLDVNPEIKLDITKLAEEDRDEVEICYALKNGMLSKGDPPTFNATQTKICILEFNTDTDKKTLKELYDGVDACVKQHDPETEGIACLKCCYKAGSKICVGINADNFF